MGNSKSKSKSVSRKKGKSGTTEVSSVRKEEFEDIELLLLRKTIEKNPEYFVLNNLMMCVQFFGNYEEEIEHVKESLASSREMELNKGLPPQKHVLLPDVLQEHIAQNVGFTSNRQTLRPTIEPLQPVRIYVVHDNIDITEANDSIQYSNVSDSITYNTLLKPTEHEGYVQLQLLEEFGMVKGRTREDEIDLSSIAEDDDEIYSDGDSIYGPKRRTDLVFTRKLNERIPKGFKYEQTRSLPNLRDRNVLSEDREILPRSNHSVRDETDYENSSSLEERRHRNDNVRFKGELNRGERRRGDKQSVRMKVVGSNGNSRTSSISSGYRSDNYTMDSESNCNSNFQNLRFGLSFNNEEMDESCIVDAELPNRCFKKVTFTADGHLYDPREEKKQLLNSKQRRIKLALRRHNYDLFYVSSTEFMKHFINIFVYRLANSFSFDRECMEDARREGCVLYCDKVIVSNANKYSCVEQYELMPAVWLQWPICAQEWLDRSRGTWPEFMDIEKIKNFGCYVVPEGFVPKRGNRNFIEDLEWQLTFPAAERYLETCMTPAQVQVYLITLMLHKSFMRPIFDTMFGLTAAHIKHKLFWMIEDNDRPSKWPDNRMGECLLTLLNSLYYNISQNEPTLRDYFIRGRNLFQRVPSEHLLHTQKQLKRIIENPVMYVFHAMENIRYGDNFFPRLDYETLLKILTADTLTLINPALAQQVSRPMSKPSVQYFSQDDKYDGTAFWDTVKNRQKKPSAQLVTNKTLINPHKATDSIIEISIRCAELEGPRLCALLDFFVRHFIKMAERCNQYRAHQQTTMYLDHADRLSILLFEHHRFKEDARAYRAKIKILRKKNESSRSQNERPETPKRNPETAIFVSAGKNRVMETATSSPETRNEQLQEASKERLDHIEHVTKAIVHEVQYEEPPNVLKADTTSIPETNEGQSLETNIVDKSQQVLTFLESSESILNESTYI
ncbi:uncharacterized protein LOC143184161 [Calliopsis andreniformis]|uniref:uncharacterized protein LOC143184161 n=1 Tax=Calliopsis andreniformis TaxID=337506 RepID=UPI003FCD2675